MTSMIMVLRRLRPGLCASLVWALTLALGVTAPAAPAFAQKRGGTLTIVRPTDPVSLDPQLETTAPGAWVYYNILEPLLHLDEKMQVQLKLASAYEVLSPTKVRFKLRPGIKFHDGTPLNAAAVKFSFDRALKGTPPARWASLAGSLAGAEVVDDLTVDVVTKEPYGPILRTLAMIYPSMVSPAAVQKLGADFSRAPVGTGPFKFVEWKTNTQIVIERNPDYWGEKALLDRVVFKVVPEEGARMIAIQTGDADMVMFPSPAQLAGLRRDPRYTVHEAPGLRVVHVGMNAKLPPLDDVRVRQALFHAVDRKAILDNIMEGSAVPARSVISPGVFGFKDMQLDQLYPFDRAKAKALLTQAGWTPGADGVLQKGGQRLTLNWLAQRGRYPKDGEITEAVQAMWQEIGVEAKVEFREWATVFTELRKPEANRHHWTFGWVTTNADADYSLYALFHSKELPPASWNRSHYANPRVDTLLEQARRSLNQPEREKLYGEAQDILAKEPVWIPIYNTKEIILTRAHVKGFVIHPVEYNLGLWRTWLDR
jgi:peptide/nickel transport system substrate-binding protein